MKRLVLALALASIAAVADPVKTDPDPNVTVFTDADGAHVVILVAPSGILGTPPIQRVMNERRGGQPKGQSKVHRSLAGPENAWITRTRVVDGRTICEVFAQRPYGETAQAERAAELFKEPCS